MSKKSKKQEEFKVTFTFPSKKSRTEFLKKTEEEILKYVNEVEEFDSITEEEDALIPNECKYCGSFIHCYDEGDQGGVDEIYEETVDALKATNGVVAKAAEDLCVDPSTIYKRIKKYGLNLIDFRNFRDFRN